MHARRGLVILLVVVLAACTDAPGEPDASPDGGVAERAEPGGGDPDAARSGDGDGVGQIDGSGELDITFTGFWLRAPDNPRSQAYARLPIDDGYHQVNQNTKELVADIDGDGDGDVVIGPAEAYRGGQSHVLAWYENPGRATTATGRST